LPERFLTETTDVSKRYCFKQHPRPFNSVCHLSDDPFRDSTFQLRHLRRWRVGVYVLEIANYDYTSGDVRTRVTTTCLDDVRIVVAYVYTATYAFCDIRISAMYLFWRSTYVFYQRTYSGDVHFDDVRVLVTYAFPWRTYFGDVRVMATYVFLTIYIYYRRTCSIDVRILSTYVIRGRTYLR